MSNYTFNPAEHKERIVQWIRNWFAENGPDCNAVIGISGGKDSTIVATLCVEALGKDRVIGVMMPDGVQLDIDDSYRVCSHLGIPRIHFDIGTLTDTLLETLEWTHVQYPVGSNLITVSDQTRMNIPPRIRMTTLYAISQSLNGRVANTCNLSETMIGWETKWGDAVGDFSPLADLTATEVIQIGLLCDIPKDLVVKTPSDGLCGKSDEDAFGFTYAALDRYLREGVAEPDIKAKIDAKIRASQFKREPIAKYESHIYRKNTIDGNMALLNHFSDRAHASISPATSDTLPENL